MKLHLNRAEGAYLIDAYGDDHIQVNGRRHQSSLVLLPDRLIADWSVREYEALDEAAYLGLAEHHPEIILVAIAVGQPAPRPRVYARLLAQGIGVEVMRLGSACRTYNVLVGEGRRALAAIILPGGAPGRLLDLRGARTLGVEDDHARGLDLDIALVGQLVEQP
jgi:uncharacterized protein